MRRTVMGAMVLAALLLAGCDDGSGSGLDGAGGVAGAGGEGGVGGEAGAGSAGGAGGQGDVDECWLTATSDGDCAAPSGGLCGLTERGFDVRCDAPGDVCRRDLGREDDPRQSGGRCGAVGVAFGEPCDEPSDCGDNPDARCTRSSGEDEKLCYLRCVSDTRCPGGWTCDVIHTRCVTAG